MIAPRYILGSFGLISRPMGAQITFVHCRDLSFDHTKYIVHLCSSLDLALIHVFVQTQPIRLEIQSSNEAPIEGLLASFCDELVLRICLRTAVTCHYITCVMKCSVHLFSSLDLALIRLFVHTFPIMLEISLSLLGTNQGPSVSSRDQFALRISLCLSLMCHQVI